MDGVTAYMIDYRVNYQVYLDTYLLIVALAGEGMGCPDKSTLWLFV